MNDSLTTVGIGLGPLPSFTPPDHCSSSFQNIYGYDWRDEASYILGPFTLRDCFPKGYNDGDNLGRLYYSPATACPTGFTPACTQVVTFRREPQTTITCCPFINTETPLGCNALWRDTTRGLPCHSIWATPTTISAITILKSYRVNTDEVTEGRTITALEPSWPGQLVATGIEIRYQESDLPPDDDETAAAGLGAGAIAGIVLGVLLGISWLAAILVWWRIVRRRRAARAVATETSTQPSHMAQATTSELPAKSLNQPTLPPQEGVPAGLYDPMGQHPGAPVNFAELPNSVGQNPAPPTQVAELSVLPIPPTERVPVKLHTAPAQQQVKN